ncbi:MAG: NINE protein [Planctomycetes bacterium]|nr:NINE protein [Planctomycetota bacterium]
MKENGVAYALWAVGPIFGIHGMHRFYMGHVGMGLLHFFTLGLCGIGWIIDAALIPGLVAESNAIAMGGYRPQQGMRFRPSQHYRQQQQQGPSTGSSIAIGIAIAFGLCLAGCFGFVLLAAIGGRSQREARVMAEMERAEIEARADDPAPARRPRARLNSNAHPEVAKLREAADRLHVVIDEKLKPLIRRFEKDLNNARKKLRRLRPKLKTDKSAKLNAQKLIQECKEIKVFLKKLNAERERYVAQVDKLDSSIRSLERKLQVADLLGQDDRAELKKLVALSNILVEEADKGFKHREGSLEAEVEDQGDDDPGEELDAELADDLDAALAEDDEE